MKIYFSENLKFLRSQKKLSQEQIGNIVGKTNRAVHHWEKGTREPSLEDIYKLSQFFKVPADVLLFNDIRQPYSPTIDQRILDDYTELGTDQQQIINDMITALKK